MSQREPEPPGFSVSLVWLDIKYQSGWVRAFVCVMCIDYLPFKSASMDLLLEGNTREGLCFFLTLKLQDLFLSRALILNAPGSLGRLKL